MDALSYYYLLFNYVPLDGIQYHYTFNGSNFGQYKPSTFRFERNDFY